MKLYQIVALRTLSQDDYYDLYVSDLYSMKSDALQEFNAKKAFYNNKNLVMTSCSHNQLYCGNYTEGKNNYKVRIELKTLEVL